MAFADIAWATAGTGMLAKARVLLNEPVANNFTDAQLLLWANRATNYILKNTKAGEIGGTTFVTLTTGSSTFTFDVAGLSTLPQVDGIGIETIIYYAAATASPKTAQAGYCLAHINPRHAGKLANTAAGVPKYWYDQISVSATGMRLITILPTPAAGQNNHLCEVLWYRTYNTYNDGASLPGQLQELVLFYILAKANEKLKRFEIADMYMGILDNYLMYFRMDNHPKPIDSSDMMALQDYTQIA